MKKELLEVLDDPSLPLHNNLSASQIREHVKRRKLSGGTRSKAGRQSLDTFCQPEENVSAAWSLFLGLPEKPTDGRWDISEIE